MFGDENMLRDIDDQGTLRERLGLTLISDVFHRLLRQVIHLCAVYKDTPVEPLICDAHDELSEFFERHVFLLRKVNIYLLVFFVLDVCKETQTRAAVITSAA